MYLFISFSTNSIVFFLLLWKNKNFKCFFFVYNFIFFFSCIARHSSQNYCFNSNQAQICLFVVIVVVCFFLLTNIAQILEKTCWHYPSENSCFFFLFYFIHILQYSVESMKNNRLLHERNKGMIVLALNSNKI